MVRYLEIHALAPAKPYGLPQSISDSETFRPTSFGQNGVCATAESRIRKGNGASIREWLAVRRSGSSEILKPRLSTQPPASQTSS